MIYDSPGQNILSTTFLWVLLMDRLFYDILQSAPKNVTVDIIPESSARNEHDP